RNFRLQRGTHTAPDDRQVKMLAQKLRGFYRFRNRKADDREAYRIRIELSQLTGKQLVLVLKVRICFTLQLERYRFFTGKRRFQILLFNRVFLEKEQFGSVSRPVQIARELGKSHIQARMYLDNRDIAHNINSRTTILTV